jgi:glutaredoxin
MDKIAQKYMKHVEGKNKGHILVYSLSNCAWCKRTKELLRAIGAEYYYIDTDRAQEKDRPKLIESMEKVNPSCIFPTIVIDGQACIIGNDEFKIRNTLGN